MDELRSHYEHELGLLARAIAAFAARYPKIAARLGVKGGHTDDLHVERLVQTFSFLAARLDSKLADDFPEFTEALLEVVHPHYLRGVPSCAIARFEPAALVGHLTAPLTLPRGTSLNARTAPVRFRSVYDVTVTPLQIASAQYAPVTLAPPSAKLPADATGIVSIAFRSATGRFTAAIPNGPVRVHLTGDRPLVASLVDALLLRAAAAYVEVDHDRRWLALSKVPFASAGFADNERLLPDSPASNGDASAVRTLLEYFAFPEMFDFVDLDIGRVRRAARAPDARELTLHVVLRNTSSESHAAQMLGFLSASAFKLFCTPVINLFPRPATPIVLTGAVAYPVASAPLTAHAPLDVYSIEAVYLSEKANDEIDGNDRKPLTELETPRVPVAPYQAFSHARSAEPSGLYWVAFHDRDAGQSTVPATMLSLVGLDGRPARSALPQLDVVTIATNRALPSRLPIGNPLGDLLLEGKTVDCPIQLMTRPTVSVRPPRGDGALWRVLSALTSHPIDLTRDGLPALKELLRLHAVSGPSAQRCVDAITDLGYKPAIRWMSLHNQQPSFVRGIEIGLSLDEAAMRDASLTVFAMVMERFFLPYGHTNSYVQLVIRSALTDKELIRGAALAGTQPVV
ncbi:type VI secretion system baseplate subunit TssF [Burkholderia sp. BCC1972]|uniref:type VI secretion system baseplate subunit TssF n=1 Tax=Burkholderia sp. BCC1972 TaxID=2817438 RepID=UPI002ABE41C9|nr:type VI secretion system baseplate subunit TssF [Burkholderia sp. BCC1972]